MSASALELPVRPAEDVRQARVLLVEDDLDVQALFGAGLRRSGFDVSTVSNTALAEAQLCVETYDAAVLDWWLPGGSGLELCRLIRSTPSMAHIPVVIVTANMMLDSAMGLCDGATMVLHKPVLPSRLAEVVGELLAR